MNWLELALAVGSAALGYFLRNIDAFKIHGKKVFPIFPGGPLAPYVTPDLPVPAVPAQANPADDIWNAAEVELIKRLRTKTDAAKEELVKKLIGE